MAYNGPAPPAPLNRAKLPASPPPPPAKYFVDEESCDEEKPQDSWADYFWLALILGIV